MEEKYSEQNQVLNEDITSEDAIGEEVIGINGANGQSSNISYDDSFINANLEGVKMNFNISKLLQQIFPNGLK